MKYLILIHSNPQSRAVWESFGSEEQQAGYELYGGISAELEASGELIVAEALADPSTGKRVTNVNGAVSTMDGPYAEVKELVNGFYLVDCVDLDRAVEIAAGFPEAAFGLIEIRPVMSLSDIGL